MGARRTEGLLVGLLLAASVGAVLFVFSVLREGDTGFGETHREAASRPPESAPRQASRPPPQPKPEPRIVPGPEPAEPEAEPEPEEDEPAREEDRPRDPLIGDRAELVLELMRPKAAEDRRVEVTVADEQGLAVQGALVVVRVGATIVFRDRTAENGVVLFAPYADEPGPFRIDAIADGFAPSHAPEVETGADTTIVLKMQPWVEGVVDAPATGQGVVTLFTDRGQRTTTVANDGTFLFEDVDPGWITVRAEVDPYGADSESFQLRAGTRQFVRLKVKPNNRVRIFGDIEPWKPEGKAWINSVPVAVTAKGRYEFPKGVFGLNEILIDVPDMALFQARFLVEGRKPQKHDFRLESDASIVGTVAASDTRQRLEGAEVRVGIDFDHPLNENLKLFPIHLVPVVYTDDKGRFEIPRLQRGALYTVSVVKHPYAQYLGEIPAKNLDRNRILLPTGPYLFGRLQGLGGVPRNARVTAYRLLAEPDRRRFNVDRWDLMTSGRDNKGFYGLGGLLPDVYVVRAEAPGYGAVETVVDMRAGDRGRMDLRVRRGNFDSSSDTELLKRLPPVIETAEEFGDQARADVTVLTIDVRRPPDEVPLPGVLVRFFEGELEFSAPMQFDEDRFDLLRLPEATYRAILSHPLLKRPIVRTDIRLRRGEPFTIVFRD